MTEQQMTVDRPVPERRIGDAEREETARLLGEHVGAGRLELAEFEQRVRSAYAARTRADLDALTSDLPGAGDRPRRRRDPRRARRISLVAVWAPWLTSTVVCLLIWGMIAIAQGGAGYFWPMWVSGPWGAILLLGTLTDAGVCGHRTGSRYRTGT